MSVDRRCYHYSSNSSSNSHWGLTAATIVAVMFNHQAGQGFVLAQNSLANMFDSAPSTIPGALMATQPTTSSVLIVPGQGQSQSQSLRPTAQPHLRTTHKDMVHDSPAAVTAAPQPSPIALTLNGVESVLSTPTVVGPTGQPQSRSRTATPIINGSPFESSQRSQRPAAQALSTPRLPTQPTASSVLVVPPHQAANDTKSNTATSNGVESDARWNVSALNILLSTSDEETNNSASASLISGRGERKGGKGRFNGMGGRNKSGNGHGRRKGKGSGKGGGGNRAKERGKGGNGEKHGKGGGMGRGKGSGGKGHGGKGGHGKGGNGSGGKGGHGGHGMMIGNMNMGMMDGGGGSGYMMGKGKGGMGGMGMMGKMMKPRTHPPTPSPSPSPSSASPSPLFFETLLPTTYSSTLLPTSFTTELPTTATITNEPTESLETVAPTTEQQETIPPTPSAAPITTDAPSAIVVSPTATTVPPSLVSSPVTSPTVVTLPPDIQSIIPTIIPSNSFSSSGPSATIGPSLVPSIIPSNSFSSSGPVVTTPPAAAPAPTLIPFTAAPVTRSPTSLAPFASITAAPVLGPTTAVPATPFSLTFDGASSDATPQDYETVIQPIVLNYLSDFLAENFALSLEFQYAALNATLLSSTPGGDNTWLSNYDLDGLFTSTSLPSTPELDVLLTVAFALPFVADLVALIQAAGGPFSTTTAVTYSATPNTL